MENTNMAELAKAVLDQYGQEQSQGEQERERDRTIYSLQEFLEGDFGEVSYLFDRAEDRGTGLIEADSLVAITGEHATGKSYLCLEIAKSLTTGDKLFGESSPFSTVENPIPTLYIQAEMRAASFQRRMQEMNFPKVAPMHVMITQGLFLDDEEDAAWLLQIIEEKGIKCLILDTFAATNRIQNENDVTQVQRVLKPLKEIRNKGVLVMFIHHNRKKQGEYDRGTMRGSSDIAAQIDMHIAIKKDGDFVIVEQEKNRSGAMVKPFKLQLKDVNEGEGEQRMRLEYVGDYDGNQDAKMKATILIMDYLKTCEYAARQHIIDVMKREHGIGKQTAGKALKAMREATKVRAVRGSILGKSGNEAQSDYYTIKPLLAEEAAQGMKGDVFLTMKQEEESNKTE